MSDIQVEDNITIISGVTNVTALSLSPNSTESSNFPTPKTCVLHSLKYGRGQTTKQHRVGLQRQRDNEGSHKFKSTE